MKYKVTPYMGQFWVWEWENKPTDRVIAMCTRKEDADKIKKSLTAYETHINILEKR